MKAKVKRLVWSILDPVLRRIGMRLAHLGVLSPPVDRAYFETIACLDASATITKEASISNSAPRENLKIGAFTFVCGEMLVSTSGGRLSLGHHCTVGQGSRIWAHEKVEIGNHVMISHSVDIHDSDSHPLDTGLRHAHTMQFCELREPFDLSHVASRPVCVEDDVWICFKASILKGVTIGRGAVVAAGAVVTKDVPPFALVAGNPAEVIRLLDKEERLSLVLANGARR